VAVEPDAEMKVTIHGVVSGIDGKPMADVFVQLMDESFTELHATNTDADGRYSFHVPAARYYALYAVKDYKVNCLEYWCWDLPADHDLVIDPFVHRLEVYSLTMSEVRYRGLESFILCFRPMGLTAAQAFMKEGHDSNTPHVQIAPDLSTPDITVKINGFDAPVYQVVKMEETTGADSDDPARSTSTMDAYVLQVGKPKQIITRCPLFCQVHIRDPKTHEEGEGGVFWEPR
jgi:hypothetical protein